MNTFNFLIGKLNFWPALLNKHTFIQVFLILSVFFAFSNNAFSALIGTYTIDPSSAASASNYLTLTSAVSDLQSGSRADGGPVNGPGVSGAVIFNITPGTYTETITIQAITGANATNTITFDGGSPSDVTVRRTAATGAVFTLQGARFIRLKNMTIQNIQTGTTYTAGIRLFSNARDNIIEGNYISLNPNTTSGNHVGILASSAAAITGNANNANDNLIINNHINGGYYGIRLNATNTTVFSYRNHIIDNKITNAYYYGIYRLYQAESEITGNEIIMRSSGTFTMYSYGMYASYGGRNLYERNTITDFGSMGMYILYENRNLSGNRYTKIINNVIGGQVMSPGTAYGLYILYNDSLDVYHNTINIHNAPGNVYAIYISWTTNTLGAKIKNNLVSISGNSGANTYCLFVGNLNAIDELDYNVFYSSAPTLVRILAVNFPDLESYQSAYSNWDQNSYEENPEFSNGYDFVHSNPCLIGEANLGVPLDFNFDVRSTTDPTIGAIEVPANNNYDIALVKWIEPLPIIQPGSYDIKLRIRNYGIQTITSANVSYSANGATPVTISYSGSIPSCEADTVTFTGSNQYTFSTSTPFVNFKTYTSNPNGQQDQNTNNDTLHKNLCLAIAGTFEVDPNGNGDFLTISEAVEALECGISGPVVINIKPGTYNENLELIINYSGASATNTITFDGINKDSVTVTSTEPVTITLRGAQYVIFQNMTINNTNSTPSIGVLLSNNADNNTILNNNINVSASTSSNAGCIFMSSGATMWGYGNNANNTLIENNVLKGGYVGVSLMGDWGSFSINNKITNNTLTDHYYYGIYGYYQQELKIFNNYIDVSGTYMYSSALEMWESNGTQIERNYLYGSYAAMWWFYENIYSSLFSSTFINNMIGGNTGTSTYYYGLYIEEINNTDFLHNSFNLEGGSANNGYGLQIYTWGSQTGNILKNNIFKSSITGITPVYIYEINTFDEMDYNLYHNPGGDIVYLGANYQSLSALQSAQPQFNENSLEEDPEYFGIRDLRIPNTKTHLRGDPTVNVPYDIFGNNRCFYMMGAYELPLPLDPPKADFIAPDTAYINTPVLFLNNIKQGEPQFYQWFVDGVYINDNQDLTYAFTQLGQYEVSLVTENCAGVGDTLTKTVIVALPVNKPIADFIANKTNVARGEFVRFADMSTHGPSEWRWEVSPPEVMVFGFMFSSHAWRESTNSQSQNPVISFPWPGLYTVKLLVSNINGEDSIVKTEYISVGYTMCPPEAPDFISSSEPKGLLFDNGGTDKYSGNQSCNFLINPCVDTLFLIIDEFELRCNQDFLRIYDGADANGKPLHCLDNNGPGFTGGDRSCTGSCLPPDTLILLSGQAYIEFRSGPGTGIDGFKLRWYGSDKQGTPEAMINVDDTVCFTSTVNFENTSVGSGLHNFSWHYGENDPSNPSNWVAVKHGSHIYSSTGDYTVRLAVEDCQGLKDTMKYEISVVIRLQLPVIDFTADNQEPMAKRDVVSLQANVEGGCNDTYEWHFTPSDFVRFVNGTDSTSLNPQVIFDVKGCYDVTLNVSNVSGTAIETKNCFIQAWDYCTPYVHTDIPSPDDIGISRVVLNGIDNFTTMGDEEKYKNFAHISTSLERGKTYHLRVERTYALNPISWAAWIDYDQNREFETYERIGYVATSNDRFWLLSFRVPEDAVIGETRLRIGTNYGNQSQLACGPHAHGEFHDYTIIITPDVTLPVITLLPPETVYVQVYNSYIEPGYSAFDEADGNLTNDIVITSTVDTSEVGVYYVNYEVSDLAGNIATAQRAVIVMDTIWPEITLLGDDTIYIEVHNNFNDPGVNVTDNYWTVNADISSNLNINVLGNYTINYCVTDGSGNGPVCVNRTVIVEDNTPPVVEMIEGDTVYVEVYNNFEDPWLIIEDNYWAEDDITVVIGGNFVDTDTLDTYFRTYTVTDGSGNTTVVTRIIKVVDTTPPVIQLIDSSFIVVRQFSEFVDPWITVSDNFDEEHHINIFTGGNFTGTDQWGSFYRSYYAVDRSGNISEIVYRNIFVEIAWSVEDLEAKGISVNVYPNPAKSMVNINLVVLEPIQGTITLTDMLGRSIKTITEGMLTTGVFETDMSEQASGIYLIRIETAEGVITERISVVN